MLILILCALPIYYDSCEVLLPRQVPRMGFNDPVPIPFYRSNKAIARYQKNEGEPYLCYFQCGLCRLFTIYVCFVLFCYVLSHLIAIATFFCMIPE